MDIPTRCLGKYVREKGINLSKMARETEIPYTALYDSLANPDRERNLRAGEMMSICAFLGIDPKSLMSPATGVQDSLMAPRA